MKYIACVRCGGNSYTVKDGYRICDFCDSRFVITQEDMPAKTSTIALSEDVQNLLERCRRDPANARRYAGLILDIDPRNPEALRILNSRR